MRLQTLKESDISTYIISSLIIELKWKKVFASKWMLLPFIFAISPLWDDPFCFIPESHMKVSHGWFAE